MATVSKYRFRPGTKEGQPVSVPCSIDLIGGTSKSHHENVNAFRNAAADQALNREIDKAFRDAN
jgi:hypothetical protein